jgi:hypothetical protein
MPCSHLLGRRGPPRRLLMFDLEFTSSLTLQTSEARTDFVMASQISKQERIRLNQQRSRARKQEYLQDLERRVQDCHTTCREADLQRDEYHQLRRENMRLRALLGSFGLPESQVDILVSSDASEPSVEQPSLRNIRPKLQPIVASPQTAIIPRLDEMNDTPRSTVSEPTPSTTTSIVLSTSSSCCGSTFLPMYPKTEVSYTSVPFAPIVPQAHFCDVFLTYFESNQGGPSGENSIGCSEARDLIEQYNIGGQDIQHILYRLATGFGPAIDARDCCQVNARLLFEVLNDISSDLS